MTYFEHVLELSFDPFLVMNAEGKIDFWNKAAERDFGWVKEEVVGQVMSSFFLKPVYREPHHAMLTSFLTVDTNGMLDLIMNTRNFFKGIPLEVVHKDGYDVNIKASVMPYLEENKWIFPAFLRKINAQIEPNTDLSRIIPRLQAIEPMMTDISSLLRKLKLIQNGIAKDSVTEYLNILAEKLQNIESNMTKLVAGEINQGNEILAMSGR